MDETALRKITEFADAAHGTQTRKYTPDRYIVHPLRVMALCREYTDDTAVLAAAILHDVVEDTEVGAEDIRMFLRTMMEAEQAEHTTQLVVELTDVYVKKAYPKLNRRARKDKELERMQQISPDAQTIKYADILDNCKEIVTHDKNFAPRFLRECAAILRRLEGGHGALRKRAQEVIEKELQLL